MVSLVHTHYVITTTTFHNSYVDNLYIVLSCSLAGQSTFGDYLTDSSVLNSHIAYADFSLSPTHFFAYPCHPRENRKMQRAQPLIQKHTVSSYCVGGAALEPLGSQHEDSLHPDGSRQTVLFLELSPSLQVYAFPSSAVQVDAVPERKRP